MTELKVISIDLASGDDYKRCPPSSSDETISVRHEPDIHLEISTIKNITTH